MRPGEYYNPAPYAEELPVVAQDAPATSRPAPLDASAFGPTWAALKDYFRPPQYSARDLESVSSPNRDVPAEPLAPPVASPSYISTAQPAPAALPGNFNGSPAPVIDAAVGQLNAGQPVTALPHQDWSLQQATAFNAKLDAFDQQAKHARIAADQAARDAHLFDQMSRVAKSTKDIEIALQQQDVMGFRNAVASGMPPVEALTRYPRAATSPVVAAARALQPVPEPKWVPPAGDAPGHFVDARGGVHIPPGGGPPMPAPKPEDLGGGITGVRVSPNKYQIVDKPGGKLPVEAAQEVAWRNADIKAAQTQKANLLKAGTRATAPDIVKLDQAIEEHKAAVRALEKAASGGKGAPAPAPSDKRVSVVGPGGRRGTVVQGTKLPDGWTLQ